MPKIRKGITKESNGKWSVNTNYSINGVNYRIHKRGFKTATEAEKAYNDEVRLLKMRFDSGNTTFFNVADLCDEYLSYIAPSLKETSLYRIRVLLKKHLANFADLSINDFCNYRNMQNFKLHISSLDDSSIAHKNRLLQIVKSFLNYAYQRGKISNENFNNVKLVLTPFNVDKEVQGSKEKQIWTKDQFKTFLSSIPKHDMYYVLFALWGQLGTRIGEIRALQVKHCHLVNGYIRIEQQVTSKIGKKSWIITTPKTKSSLRNVTITEEMALLLNDYIDSLKLTPSDFLFSAKINHDAPISENAIRLAIKKYSKMANVPEITTHGLRHSNTTWLLTGEDIPVEEIAKISERLGHSSKMTTLNIYLHINKKENSKILSSLKFTLDE